MFISPYRAFGRHVLLCSGARLGPLSCLAVVLSALSMPVAAPAQSGVEKPAQDRLDQILADWAQRRRAVSNATYKWEAHILLPKAHSGAEGDVILKDRGSMLFEFPSRRYRMSRDEEGYNVTLKRIGRYVNTAMFDGDATWGIGGDPDAPKRPKDDDLLVRTGNLSNVRIDPNLAPLFLGHGILQLRHDDFIEPRKFPPEPTRRDFAEKGASSYNGKQCFVLRYNAERQDSASYKDIWVDPSRASAVLRIAEYRGNNLSEDTNISYEKSASGWFVNGWTCRRWFHYPNEGARLANVRDYRMTELQFNRPVEKSDFQLEIKPGMLIRRYHQQRDEAKLANPLATPPGDYYRVMKDGREVLEFSVPPPPAP